MLTKVTMIAMYQHDPWMAQRLRARRRIQAKKSQPCQMRGAQAGFFGGSVAGPAAMSIRGQNGLSPRTAVRGMNCNRYRTLCERSAMGASAKPHAWDSHGPPSVGLLTRDPFASDEYHCVADLAPPLP